MSFQLIFSLCPNSLVYLPFGAVGIIYASCYLCKYFFPLYILFLYIIFFLLFDETITF